jgi:hypothetical protein
MFVPHRKHTYGSPRPVIGIDLLFCFIGIIFILTADGVLQICVSSQWIGSESVVCVVLSTEDSPVKVITTPYFKVFMVFQERWNNNINWACWNRSSPPPLGDDGGAQRRLVLGLPEVSTVSYSEDINANAVWIGYTTPLYHSYTL